MAMSVSIGIIGTGGVGGYFGGKICRSLSGSDARVWFVARGRHLEEIRRNGLAVRTAAEGDWVCRPTAVTDVIEDLPPLDLCLLCVKSYDLVNVLPRLCGALSERTIVIPLLNGVDIYERVRRTVATARVLPACVYVGTHIEVPGVVRQAGGACRILLGADPQGPAFRPEAVFECFDRSGVAYEWFDDVAPELWKKFLFIAAFGLVTAASGRTLGEVMDDPAASAQVLAIMREIAAIARAAGISLSGSIVEDSHGQGRRFPPETKTSFQRDFERSDRPDERDLFAGTILRMGARLKVPTPATREASELLDRHKPA
jgi:2-dehydropantoate 2-reductase